MKWIEQSENGKTKLGIEVFGKTIWYGHKMFGTMDEKARENVRERVRRVQASLKLLDEELAYIRQMIPVGLRYRKNMNVVEFVRWYDEAMAEVRDDVHTKESAIRELLAVLADAETKLTAKEEAGKN